MDPQIQQQQQVRRALTALVRSGRYSVRSENDGRRVVFTERTAQASSPSTLPAAPPV